MVVIVCGSRFWKARGPIQRELEARKSSIKLVIDGVAPGADTIGNAVAKSLGLDFKRIPAKWHIYGKPAGPIRNSEMLKVLLAHEDTDKLVLAFHEDIRSSKGTKHMVEIAEKAGVPCLVFGRVLKKACESSSIGGAFDR